jgi:hypothetical protein
MNMLPNSVARLWMQVSRKSVPARPYDPEPLAVDRCVIPERDKRASARSTMPVHRQLPAIGVDGKVGAFNDRIRARLYARPVYENAIEKNTRV